MRFAANCSVLKLIYLRVDLALSPRFIAIHSQFIDAAPAPLQVP